MLVCGVRTLYLSHAVTHAPCKPLKTFKDAVRTSDFALTAEIYLRPETDAASLREQAELLKHDVDAILLTDNQHGQLHLSTIAAASILLAAGIDPVVQLTCRNRNRIALISELMGAAALGLGLPASCYWPANERLRNSSRVRSRCSISRRRS